MSLFEPLNIRDVTFKNRIGVSPMCQYSSIDGFANDWHFVHLGSRAVGGAGMVMMEATAVTEEGRISPGDMGLWKDEQIEFLSRITAFIKSQGSVPGIQLAHAGRKASHSRPWEGDAQIAPDAPEGWQTIAPSAVAFQDDELPPAEMSLAQIKSHVEAFVAATQRAVKAGYEVIEIHAAHGYLINEFLSPLSNFRTDEYGGSFENRTRFLLEIVDGVRAVIPQGMPLFTRISAIDWVEGGWQIEDSIELAKLLKAHGVDLIDSSSGGNAPDAKITTGPGYQVPFAEQIRHGADIPTAAVGMITDAQQADELIRSGKSDMVLLARELLRDPYWPKHAALELGLFADPPQQYSRAFPRQKVKV